MANYYPLKALIMLNRACELYKKLRVLGTKDSPCLALETLENQIKTIVEKFAAELEKEFLQRAKNDMNTLCIPYVQDLSILPEKEMNGLINNFITDLKFGINPAEGFFNKLNENIKGKDQIKGFQQKVLEQVQNKKNIINTKDHFILPQGYCTVWMPKETQALKKRSGNYSFSSESSFFSQDQDQGFQLKDIKNNKRSVILKEGIIDNKISFIYYNHEYTLFEQEFDNINLFFSNTNEKDAYHRLFNKKILDEDDKQLLAPLMPKILRKKMLDKVSSQFDNEHLDSMLQDSYHREFQSGLIYLISSFNPEDPRGPVDHLKNVYVLANFHTLVDIKIDNDNPPAPVLYYYNNEGQCEKVTIKEAKKFIEALKVLHKNQKDGKIVLSPEHLQQLITSNGGPANKHYTETMKPVLNEIIKNITTCELIWMSSEEVLNINAVPQKSRYILTDTGFYYQSLYDQKPALIQNNNLKLDELQKKFPQNDTPVNITEKNITDLETLSGFSVSIPESGLFDAFDELFFFANNQISKKQFNEDELNNFQIILEKYSGQLNSDERSKLSNIHIHLKNLQSIILTFPLTQKAIVNMFNGQYDTALLTDHFNNFKTILDFTIQTLRTMEALTALRQQVENNAQISDELKQAYLLDKNGIDALHNRLATYFSYMLKFPLHMPVILKHIEKWNDLHPNQLIDTKNIQKFSIRMSHIVSILNAIQSSNKFCDKIQRFNTLYAAQIHFNKEPFRTLNDLRASLVHLSTQKFNLTEVQFDQFGFFSLTNFKNKTEYSFVAEALKNPKSDFIVSIQGVLYYGSYITKELTKIDPDEKNRTIYEDFLKKCTNDKVEVEVEVEVKETIEPLTDELKQNIKSISGCTPYHVEEALALKIQKQLSNANIHLGSTRLHFGKRGARRKEAYNLIKQIELELCREIKKIQVENENTIDEILNNIQQDDILNKAPYKTIYVQVNEKLYEVNKTKITLLIAEKFDPGFSNDARMTLEDLEKIQQHNQEYNPWQSYTHPVWTQIVPQTLEQQRFFDQISSPIAKLDNTIFVMKEKINTFGNLDKTPFNQLISYFELFSQQIKQDLEKGFDPKNERFHYKGNIVLINKMNKLGRFLIDNQFKQVSEKSKDTSDIQYLNDLKNHLDSIQRAIDKYPENNTPTIKRVAGLVVGGTIGGTVGIGAVALITFLTGGLTLPIILGIGAGALILGSSVFGTAGYGIGFFKTKHFAQKVDLDVEEKSINIRNQVKMIQKIPSEDKNTELQNNPTLNQVSQDKKQTKRKTKKIRKIPTKDEKTGMELEQIDLHNPVPKKN